MPRNHTPLHATAIKSIAKDNILITQDNILNHLQFNMRKSKTILRFSNKTYDHHHFQSINQFHLNSDKICSFLSSNRRFQISF